MVVVGGDGGGDDAAAAAESETGEATARGEESCNDLSGTNR